MTTDADVIIAGAGPAGTLAAYELAIRGVSVLILEKSEFPRYKVCGAGLTHKILARIPFDVSPVLETQVYTVQFTNGFREPFSRSSSEPMLYCTSRDKFDQFLLDKAVEAGCRVVHGQHVMSAIQEQESVTVMTRTGVYHGRLLIGADGASGNVSCSAGLNDNIISGLAWEAEIRVDTASLNTFSQTVFLDWGSFPGGYGWVFPKGEHFSIGVGGPAKLSRWMMPYYQVFVEYLEMKFGIHVLETMSIRSWPIPVRVKKSRFHNGRIIVAGDAAGLTDPLTGEGIYYAIRSGTLAAKCSHDFLSGLSDSLASYSNAVNEELMTELMEANRIKYLFNAVPGRIHRFVRDNDRAWRAFGKILRGERSYVDVKGGFGKWQVLWTGACSISKWISDNRETSSSQKGVNLCK